MTPKKWSRFIKPDALADGLMLLMEGAIVMSYVAGDQNAAPAQKWLPRSSKRTSDQRFL